MDIHKLHTDCLLEALDDTTFKKAIDVLNERFTTRRQHLAGYTEDSTLVSAYAAFYLPTNMLKLPFVLERLPRFPVSLDAPVDVVDFGCGPGTYGFALYEYLSGMSPSCLEDVVFYFVDRSRQMLQQAQKIQEILYPRMRAQFHTTVPAVVAARQRLLLMGNVVNETGADGFVNLQHSVAGLCGDAMIFIEPGTQGAFKMMSQLRRHFISDGFHVWYPCATNGDCPLDESEDNWCHQVLKASLSADVARMGQLVALDRSVMPFIAHVYTKTRSAPASAMLFRLKSHSKHAFFWEVCMPDDSGLVIRKIELPKKGYSKKEQKALERVCAGQRIAFSVEKALGNGTFRVDKVLID